jgi:hypothetical protein
MAVPSKITSNLDENSQNLVNPPKSINFGYPKTSLKISPASFPIIHQSLDPRHPFGDAMAPKDRTERLMNNYLQLGEGLPNLKAKSQDLAKAEQLEHDGRSTRFNVPCASSSFNMGI